MPGIDTGTDELVGRVEDGVAVLQINRPDHRNALSDEIYAGLAKVLIDAESDPDIGVVVLTGTGRAFSAGGDVKRMAARNAGPPPDMEELINRQRRLQRATSGRFWSLSKPTIAAIRGPAVGAGLSFALACDLRYASTDSVLVTGFARVGLAGDYGAAWFLTRIVGSAKARELMFFSDPISPETALALGLVNDVFPDDEFDAAVMARAKRLADGPGVAYRYMKENLNSAVHLPLDEYLDVEVIRHRRTALTDDHKEAASAFAEKRTPSFNRR